MEGNIIKTGRADFCVCKLKTAEIGDIRGFFAFTRTESEYSLVCGEKYVPKNAEKVEGGWRMFEVIGPLDFALTGVIARITSILAKSGISVFVVSTYLTDYFMVKKERHKDAIAALVAKGYSVVE